MHSSHPSLSNFHFFYQKFFTPLGIQIFSSLQNPKETHDTPSNNYLSPHKSLLQTLSYLKTKSTKIIILHFYTSIFQIESIRKMSPLMSLHRLSSSFFRVKMTNHVPYRSPITKSKFLGSFFLSKPKLVHIHHLDGVSDNIDLQISTFS